MTKQEEIKRGIAEIVVTTLIDETDYLESPELNQIAGDIVGKILSYLHSQGVVIKVKCPSCVFSQFGDEAVGMSPCFECNGTGHKTEPLRLK